MWLLTFVPDFIIHLLVLVGAIGILVGLLLTKIPLIKENGLLIEIVSALVLALGLYLEGGLSYKEDIELKVKELEAKLAKAEKKSAETNVQIVTKILTKKQIIKEKGDRVIQYIDREIVKYDNSCPIPDVVIRAHNAAAANDPSLLENIDTKKHDDATKKKSTMILPAK